ncbi:MAG TPA: phosphoribosylanthranilate isomerase [Solirubrobacteraceae bacterium]|nr:phosphoribosylanthranilate isomerase [Solirubrobacteraceae bacterium]
MTRVKICGTTSVADAERAADLGAWAVGLIFVPGTPRRVEGDEAAAIAAALRRRTEVCGVFANAPLGEVAAVADAVGLTMLQLHGDEGPSYCAEVARRTGAKVAKAARVRSRADLHALEAFHTDFHLLDAHVDGQLGGTGTTWDWDLVAQRRTDAPLVVSGGLTPENVGEAIRRTRPFAVDVASGVEAEPGRKDAEKLEAFFAAARGQVPA